MSTYHHSLCAQNKITNLIASKDLELPIFVQRHMADSLQLIELLEPHITKNSPLIDIGTGAGLPGLLLAIAGLRPVHLVEPRKQRVIFLEKMITELDIHCTLHSCHIQSLPAKNQAILISRAFKPLPQAFQILSLHLQKARFYFCLKGTNYITEIESLRKRWSFDLAIYKSLTHSESSILRFSHVRSL